jgi:hypothetical protein
MNERLERLADHADGHGVDLSNSTITMKYRDIEFMQYNETRESFRKVKKWVGGFKAEGKPPYVDLRAKIEVHYLVNGEPMIDEWRIKWSGAYDCKLKGYDCRPALFSDEAEDHAADIEVEDSQLNS